MSRVVLFVVLFLSIASGNLVIPPPHPFAGTYPTSQYRSFGWQSFSNVTLPMITLSSPQTSLLLCVGGLNLLNVTGKIVAFAFPFATTTQPGAGLVFVDGGAQGQVPGCAYELMISNCERAGCAGLVRLFENDQSQQNSPIPPIFWWANLNRSFHAPQNTINFPCMQAQIGPAVNLLFLQFAVPNPNFTFPEVNVVVSSQLDYYQQVGGTYGIFYQVWIALWSLFNTISAGVFIFAQLKRRTAEFPLLAVVALSLECFCNLMRFTVAVVDPFVVWGVYWPIYILQIWLSFFFSWSLVATFLIAFFWFRLSFHSGRKLNVTSPVIVIPCVIVSLLILAVEYVPLMYLVFSPTPVNNSLLGRTIAQSLCYWIISAFFILSGARILILIRRGARMHHRKDERQRNMARFVVVDAILLTSFGAFIYSMIGPLAQTTNMWYGLVTVQSFFLLLISTIQIWVFASRPVASGPGDASTPTDSVGDTVERDSDGYLKADLGCCGRKLKSSSSSRSSRLGSKSQVGGSMTNNSLGNSGKSLDAPLPDSEVVDGIVEL